MSASRNNMVWKIKSFDQLSADELYKILQARIDVFVVEQRCPYPELDGYDQSALHLWAEIDGEVLAYCRIFPPGIKYDEASIGRVLTKKNFRGLNLGKNLVKFALNTIEARYKITSVRISAQDYLLKFYSDFGFLDSGKKYLEDDIPHTEMLRL
ncbi:GNAT family N-acetyltransferase [Chryseobacterium taklimakanense]|uniref:GNAT family N-acetyltransferase n=1 Tax=Chryseobacterium taklimakanense TaxID=536441 RepID=A0A3G8WT06_9FLAO|nr:GNAT family N-acetyltransferase [Chryseobacterium taklimakanense]AZI21314.1 GNAT family N-acetyltransferase [Chryseobacterium taklimakanense]